MHLAGKSLNHGIEQEHLDNLPGARVLITSHQPDHGPGIEFLNYLEPNDARPRPLTPIQRPHSLANQNCR